MGAAHVFHSREEDDGYELWATRLPSYHTDDAEVRVSLTLCDLATDFSLFFEPYHTMARGALWYYFVL